MAQVLEDQKPLEFGTVNSVEWEINDSNFALTGITRIISDELRIQHGGSSEWFSNPNRTVRSDSVNCEPIPIAVLLTQRT